ncbi:hypothetical protein BYT27DRAFT_7185387, partial [Phlegmacium glaucopus]
MSSTPSEEASLLDKLDTTPLLHLWLNSIRSREPSTYKARSESRRFVTLRLAFMLVVYVILEILCSGPDFEFSMDNHPSASKFL